MAARRRRALVVAYDFPPHAAIGTMRTLRLVRALAEEQWDVTVLTSEPSAFRSGTPVDLSLLGEVPSSVRIVRAPAFRGFESLKTLARPHRPTAPGAAAASSTASQPSAPRHRSALSRAVDLADAVLAIPDHESGWMIPAISAGMTACRGRRPDVLYSSAPPWTGQLVARALAVMLRCRWVADFRDPWSRAPWRGDRIRLATWAAARLENLVIKRADRVIFVAKGNRDDFARHYGEPVAAKFDVVANGCDPSEFDRVGPSLGAASDRFVLLHAGSLYAGRTPVPLLRALARAIHNGAIDATRFRLRFLGTLGGYELEMHNVCRELNLTDVVEFHPRVPRDQSVRETVAASGLLLLQPGHAFSVPGKVYEYLAAGRPILAIVEPGSETEEVVKSSGMGFTASPDDETAIVDALMATVQRNRSHLPPIPRDLYDGTARARQIAGILAVVAREGPHSYQWSPDLHRQ